MKIRRLRMINYRRHVDTEIELPDGVTAIVGRNGSGKSSILEAIAFALYGTQATRTNKDLLRHDRAAKGDELRVELDLDVAGQALQVVRSLRGANQTGQATLVADGQTIVPAQAGSMEAVTSEITQRIGLDRETFFSSVFTPQKDLARLAARSRTERKKLILGMLGIDALDAAIAEGRSRKRAAEARLAALQDVLPDLDVLKAEQAAAVQVVEGIQARIAACDKDWDAAKQRLQAAKQQHRATTKAEQERRDAEARLQAAQATLTNTREQHALLRDQLQTAQDAESEAASLDEAASDLQPARKALEDAISADHAAQRRVELEAEIKDLEKRLDDAVVPTVEPSLIEQADKEVAAARAAVDATKSAQTSLETQYEQASKRLQRMDALGDDADCPVCERPLEGHAERLAAHLRDEMDSLAKDIEAAKGKVAAAQQAEEKAVRASQRVQQRLETANTAKAQREQLRQNLERNRTRLAELPPALDHPPLQELRERVAAAEGAMAKLTRARAMAEALPRLAGQIETLAGRLDELGAAVDAARQAVDALGDTGTGLLQAEETLRGAELAERQAERDRNEVLLEAKAATAAVDAANRRLDDADKHGQELAEARLDHQHWQCLAGDRGTGLLDRFRSHLVGRIGPSIQAEASRLLSAFTAGRYTEVLLDDEYDIFVVDDGVAYSLERFSGGESDLVHLALRLAISRLLLERGGGAEIRFLALDEVFGSLDGERRQLVLQALETLGTLYSQVLVVTHHEGLQDGLDHVLMVEDQDGEAVARLHNG